MIDFLIIQTFLISLALGTLIGLEREYARYRKRAHNFAGIRTFPLITLFGTMSAYLGDKVSPYILLIGMLLIGLLIIVAYFFITRHSAADFSATSEVAGFLMFFIGILVYNQEYSLATIITVIIAIILFARSVLHHFAERLTKKEMTSTLTFAVIAFLILPFLPDKGYGPWELFNPYLTWLMVVFVSGISFIGYALIKWFGEKGITFAGMAGGLISSTATTTSFAQRSHKDKKVYRALVLGTILANGVMLLRILVVVFALNQTLFVKMIIPIFILVIITAIFSYFLWQKAKKVQGKITLTSPMALSPAIKFAILFAVVIALAKIANYYLAAEGIYVISFLSGIADVDAITISLSQLAKENLALQTAGRGILIAAMTNMMVKGGIAYFLGRKEFGRTIALFFGLLIILGAVILMFI